MKKKQIPVLIILSIVTFLAVIYLTGLLYFSSHFLPGTTLNGTEVSFMNREETQDLLDLMPVKLVVDEKDKDGNDTISEELELHDMDGIDLHYVAQKIDHYQDAATWFLSLLNQKQLLCDKCEGSYSKDVLEKSISHLYCLQEENQRVPEAAHIAFEENELKIIDASDGSLISKEKVLQLISEALDKALSGETLSAIDLRSSYEKSPDSNRNELESQFSVLQKILNKKITISISENKTESLEGNPLKELLALKDNTFIVDDTKLESYANRIVDQYSISSSEYIKKGPLKDALRKALLSETDTSVECGWAKEAGTRSSNLIEVSYSEQMLYYYENGELIFSSPVVTGNEDTEIIAYGTYYVQHMKRNATLVSSTYEEHVDYWIGFDFESGGHILGFHDAQWRDAFGGDIWRTDPSHGCVNMPTDKVAMLYEAVDIGTEIHIHE
ncbi:MAG: L,D-transpeptidase [Erysipelotrichaceae bacterium]|nr:L,D-transpeptidase [Erysipelotrichaceae bacterium]